MISIVSIIALVIFIGLSGFSNMFRSSSIHRNKDSKSFPVVTSTSSFFPSLKNDKPSK